MLDKFRAEGFISVDDLAVIMGISRSFAYEYVKDPACPFLCLKMGKRIVIPTNNFFNWYDGLAGEETNTDSAEIKERNRK